MEIEQRSVSRCFGGRMSFNAHRSSATGTEMRFAVFEPSQAAERPVGALFFLAGLTCTEETFMIKAGAQRFAAEHGILLVAPDTSPRGAGVPGEDDDWDFGTGAGFYLDAVAEPWARHYRMATYISDELPAVIEAHFPVRPGVRGICGHSMGGHGALVTALRDPPSWRSVSALAPIANPSAVPWGEKAFANYLGPNRASWAEWDAALLMQRQRFPGPILVDQGSADQFLETQLHPAALREAAAKSGQALSLRLHEGYDHSYWFIQTFIGDHIAHHAAALA